MTPQEMIREYVSAAPALKAWIEELLETRGSEAVQVSKLGFSRLPHYFPDDFLERAKAVSTSEIPFPPLGRLGLPELSVLEQMPVAGITFKNTFFMGHLHRTETLCFHELIHVAQWERLGVDRFLLAYGVGLVRHGYEQSPLERMAYRLQKEFEQKNAPRDLMKEIHRGVDSIWREVLGKNKIPNLANLTQKLSEAI